LPYILVLFYSRNGSVQSLANEIANGIESVGGITALVRTVPAISSTAEQSVPEIPTDGPLYCTQEEFENAHGLAIGSPGRFGNMAASLKYFLELTTTQWINGDMVGKPATVFTSTTTPHGGQESTLLSMMNPLLHHGMLITGVPFTEPAIHKNVNGGTPYGVSHVAGEHHQPLSKEIASLCRTQGKRLAKYALRLSNDSAN
jgi:NAD(P)H dehydrogenase (quinone)